MLREITRLLDDRNLTPMTMSDTLAKKLEDLFAKVGMTKVAYYLNNLERFGLPIDSPEGHRFVEIDITTTILISMDIKDLLKELPH
jgi:hypothetical protein